MKKFVIYSLVFVVLLMKNVSAQESIAIRLNHKVGTKTLVLFDETYTNAFNEPFVVNKFRYYISNVVMTDEKGKLKSFKGFNHLVDEADTASKKMVFNSFGLGKIISVEFTIGVDSIKNTSGVQTGDLDPMKGMFWTWNTGYIFAKLEGTSDSSNAAAHYFNFDVGGYKKNENAARKIKLNINSTSAIIKEIVINVDISKFFNAVHPIHISKTPICHQPGELAMKLADNYATMFSIAAIK